MAIISVVVMMVVTALLVRVVWRVVVMVVVLAAVVDLVEVAVVESVDLIEVLILVEGVVVMAPRPVVVSVVTALCTVVMGRSMVEVMVVVSLGKVVVGAPLLARLVVGAGVEPGPAVVVPATVVPSGLDVVSRLRVTSQRRKVLLRATGPVRGRDRRRHALDPQAQLT